MDRCDHMIQNECRNGGNVIVCLFSAATCTSQCKHVLSENVFITKMLLGASYIYILALSTVNCAQQRSYAFSHYHVNVDGIIMNASGLLLD